LTQGCSVVVERPAHSSPSRDQACRTSTTMLKWQFGDDYFVSAAYGEGAWVTQDQV